jgi:hypothetical protein
MMLGGILNPAALVGQELPGATGHLVARSRMTDVDEMF